MARPGLGARHVRAVEESALLLLCSSWTLESSLRISLQSSWGKTFPPTHCATKTFTAVKFWREIVSTLQSSISVKDLCGDNHQ